MGWLKWQDSLLSTAPLPQANSSCLYRHTLYSRWRESAKITLGFIDLSLRPTPLSYHFYAWQAFRFHKSHVSSLKWLKSSSTFQARLDFSENFESFRWQSSLCQLARYSRGFPPTHMMTGWIWVSLVKIGLPHQLMTVSKPSFLVLQCRNSYCSLRNDKKYNQTAINVSIIRLICLAYTGCL